MDIAEGAGLLPATGDSELLLPGGGLEEDGESKTGEAAESKDDAGPASGAGAPESKSAAEDHVNDVSEKTGQDEEDEDPVTILSTPLPSLVADLLALVRQGSEASINAADVSDDSKGRASGESGFTGLHRNALDFLMSLAQVAAAGETRYQVAGSAKGTGGKTLRIFPALLLALLKVGVSLLQSIADKVEASTKPGAELSGNPGDMTLGQESTLRQAVIPLLGFAS